MAELVDRVRALSEVSGWTVLTVRSTEWQTYLVRNRVEAQRSVQQTRALVTLLHDHAPHQGSCSLTLQGLSEPELRARLREGVYIASTVDNKPYALLDPRTDYAEVPVCDPEIAADPEKVASEYVERLRAAVSQSPEVHLASAEFFFTRAEYNLQTSTGIDRVEMRTTAFWDGVVLAGEHEQVEHHFQRQRRRPRDWDLEAFYASQVRYASDRLRATPTPSRESLALVVPGDVLSDVLAPVVFHLTGAAKFNRLSQWEIGTTVWGDRPLIGEPLQIVSSRLTPFGSSSASFDEDGFPAARIPLVEDGKVAKFVCSKQYADYLGLPATGRQGDLHIASGARSAAELHADPCLEVVSFAALQPDNYSGALFAEIRLGYLHEGGTITPVTGGAVVGNVLAALANTRYASEQGFWGNVVGPTCARLEDFSLVGS